MDQFTAVAKTEHRWLVEILFNDRCLAGKPLQKDMIKGMVRAQLTRKAKKEKKDPNAFITDELVNELVEREIEHLFGEGADEAIEDAERLRSNVFESDEIGPHLGAYQMKAGLNDCVTTLGLTSSKKGFKQTIQHCTAVLGCDENGVVFDGRESGHLYFYDDDWDFVEEPDGLIEICGHVVDASGPRSILKKSEYTQRRRLRFIVVSQELDKSRKRLELLNDDMCRILNAAQHNAVGAVRKLGHGKYRVTRLEKVQ
tara:strand:+ start:103 stop:870 length:768 start_codon:yes stop_codon:yes gene_type:complete